MELKRADFPHEEQFDIYVIDQLASECEDRANDIAEQRDELAETRADLDIADFAGDHEAYVMRCAELDDEVAELNYVYEDWDHDRMELQDLHDTLANDGIDSLICADGFTDYARELAEETCSIDPNAWPLSSIDWDEAADELRQDYTEYDIDGTTYLGR